VSAISSALHSHSPARSPAFLRRLVMLLVRDENRRKPAVSLAGPARPTPPPPLPPPKPPASLLSPAGHVQGHPQLKYEGQQARAEAEPSDLRWTYSRDQLLRMDKRFCRRVERAFKRGLESRNAAAATVLERRPNGFGRAA
jgi:hypothetical protein